MEANPKTSCRQIGIEVNVCKSKVQRILKKHKYVPYKAKIVHHLHAGDADRRIIFCRWYLQKVQENRHFGRNIIWSDECHVSSAGIFNRNNNRHWSDQNQHVIISRQQQGRFGFNVSCFIFGGRIAYHIFEGNLNSEIYIEILNTCLAEIIDDIPLAQYMEVYFQQDGAPSHNARSVRDYLNRHFPNKWIGTNGPVNWPPRSPDLSILDFFVWGYLKNMIYKRRHENREELLNSTREAFNQLRIRPMYLFRAIDNISRRCDLCMRYDGNQFEQYIK